MKRTKKQPLDAEDATPKPSVIFVEDPHETTRIISEVERRYAKFRSTIDTRVPEVLSDISRGVKM